MLCALLLCVCNSHVTVVTADGKKGLHIVYFCVFDDVIKYGNFSGIAYFFIYAICKRRQQHLIYFVHCYFACATLMSLVTVSSVSKTKSIQSKYRVFMK